MKFRIRLGSIIGIWRIFRKMGYMEVGDMMGRRKWERRRRIMMGIWSMSWKQNWIRIMIKSMIGNSQI